MRVNGDLSGIKDTYLEMLDKLYDTDVQQEILVSDEILNIITDITRKTGKEISVYISRRGKVVDVSVGDYSSVNLLAIDYRRGNKRLSGVRCIHTHPSSSGMLSSVDISALLNLRLDLISAVGVSQACISNIYIGYLNPVSGSINESTYKMYGPLTVSEALSFTILGEIKSIEREINTFLPEETESNKKERVLLAGIKLPESEENVDDLMDELAELAGTAGAEVAGKFIQKRNKIDNAYYIGSGKAHELSLLRQAYNIDTIIFDDELSGPQVRNLEETTGARIIDRTALILDIFAQRAQTKEGKLQVELAQLKYRLPRLIGAGRELSRTGGGIGTRGPGEKKLEIDRRRIRERIEELEKGLDEVRKNRNTQREKRKQSSIPIVSLVGYTNSGKSTLRNTLSRLYPVDASMDKEDVLEANMLFATLDPTTRLIKSPKGYSVLISDTVGFIRKLPHDLVEAFKATLEEVVYSDLLVHVIDSSAPNAKEQMIAVENVLKQIGAGDKSVISVLNKVDKMADKDSLAVLSKGLNDVVEISALYGDKIDSLLSLIEDRLFGDLKNITFKIPYTNMSIKSNIYGTCRVLSEDYDENSVIINAEVDKTNYNRYKEYIIDEN
jgi:GTP-binding protein HflX